MAHPYNSVRDHKVSRSRVGSIAKACGGGMKSGGSATGDKGQYRSTKAQAYRADGGAVQERADRPARRRGGRLGSKKGTKGNTVNVIVASNPATPPLGAAMPRPPGPPPMPPPAAAPPPMRPPVAGPPPGGGMGMPPGAPPPGILPRKRGGAVSAAETVGIGKKIPVEKFFPTNKQTLSANVGRKAPITKAKGGPISSPATGHMGPMFTGGGRGGMARLEKTARLAREKYGRPTISVKNPTQDPKHG